MVVRNEMLRLASVLAHYRKLGADRFLIVDNASDDGTAEFLAREPDVHSWTTKASFAGSKFGMEWINALLAQHCIGNWVLLVDADELFIYPHFERANLKELCRFLDTESAGAMFGLMIDMYADKPIRDTHHRPGASLLESCPYCDPLRSYRSLVAAPFPHLQLYGGPRERVFAKGGLAGPLLSKVPLVKWRAGMRFTDVAHALEPAVPLSRVLGALLHFKFLDDFHERARIEVERGEHYDNASEYRTYLDALDANPSVTLRTPESVRYQSSAQLVALHLMHSAPAYDRFVAELG